VAVSRNRGVCLEWACSWGSAVRFVREVAKAEEPARHSPRNAEVAEKISWTAQSAEAADVCFGFQIAQR